MPYGKHIIIVKVEVDNKVKEQQKIVEKIILNLREIERLEKQCLELEKDQVMIELMDVKNKEEDKELKTKRQNWLRGYSERLKKIGITRKYLENKLSDVKSVKVKEDAIVIFFENKEYTLFNLYEGDKAFDEVMPDKKLKRTIYEKKGGDDYIFGKKKHYVRDYFGRYTRRFAYVEKPLDVFEILLTDKKLIGKDVKTKLGGNPFKKTNFVMAKYDLIESGNNDKILQKNIIIEEKKEYLLEEKEEKIIEEKEEKIILNKKDNENLSIRELAFINQEDGSTTQRGLALSSTKKSLHGNEGYRFGTRNGVILKIDLAMIPENNVEYLLLNLYSFDAQNGPEEEQTIGLSSYEVKVKNKNVRRDKFKFDHMLNKKHTDTSTLKNRELLLLKLPLEAVHEVIFHDKNIMDKYSESIQNISKDIKISYQPHSAKFDEEFYPKN